MPKIFSNSLKMSLLSGLFVFIAFYGFTIYCVILCFVLCNTQVILWYSHSHTYFFQKQPFFSTKHLNTASEIPHASVSWMQLLTDLINYLTRLLYFCQHSKKYSIYTFKVLKNSLNKLKSAKKLPKAVEIYSTRLLFSVFQLCYCSFFNLNPTL
jgi:hypothetical protein